MKKILTLTFFLTLSAASFAQAVSDGFYRVQNYGSKRYTYVYDNTGSVNVQGTTADMGAIVLYSDAHNRFTDPASVIYIHNVGKNDAYTLYDLEAQGTGVSKIINYYVSVVNGNIPGTYWVYQPTFNMYLWDAVTSTNVPKSYVKLEPGTKPDFRCWMVHPIDATTDEYLGIEPDATMKAGGKYYKPYYLGFSMTLESSGMKAYYVSDVKADAVIIKEIQGAIPAATPVIIECSAAEATNNRVNALHDSYAPISDNKLKGNYFCYGSHSDNDRLLYDEATMRVLCVKDGKLQYATDPLHQHTTALKTSTGSGYYVNANESYLQVPAGTPAELPVMTQAEYDALHPTTKKGDINGDGFVNGTDAALLNSLIAAGRTARETPLADINSDGLINGTDAALLNSLIAAGK